MYFSHSHQSFRQDNVLIVLAHCLVPQLTSVGITGLEHKSPALVLVGVKLEGCLNWYKSKLDLLCSQSCADLVEFTSRELFGGSTQHRLV